MLMRFVRRFNRNRLPRGFSECRDVVKQPGQVFPLPQLSVPDHLTFTQSLRCFFAIGRWYFAPGSTY
jgi:hypothetical protein